MLTMLTAYTSEIDDIAIAIDEVLEQLDLKNSLRRHSVGILSCYSEFLETGVVKALCDSVPFDVIGCTTMASGTNRQNGIMILSLCVLTSDEVSFATSQSAPLSVENCATSLGKAYQKAADALQDKPSLAIPIFPTLNFITGESLVEALDTISSGLPVFGTLPCDNTNDYSQSFVIYNGEASGKSMALLLLSGPISPKFHIVSIPEERRQKQNAIITSSEGNLLHSVNNMPLLQYLETLGLCEANNVETAKIVPFVVDYNDGTTPVVRGIYSFTPEGSAMCGGLMPLNGTLSIGSLDYLDVINSVTTLMDEVKAREDASVMLIFSCICRGWALGTDMLAELDRVQESTQLPYMMCYSGGEVCPVYNTQGSFFNRFHNYTCIICTI